MRGMRALTLVAVAGAAAEASQQGHVAGYLHAPAVVPRDDCTDLPKLCTDAVLLRGYETTLTYLCPKTQGPSTVTVTTTCTTTVMAELTSSVSAMVTSIGQTPAIEEPTTTETIKSTTQVTVTKLVTRVGTTSLSLSPPTITWSFTAILPSDVNGSGMLRKSSSIPPDVVSTPVSSVSAAPTSSTSDSLEHFPTYVVINSSSISSTSSAVTLPSLGMHRPIYWNHTGIHSIVDFPTANLARDAEPKSTETVTGTAAVATKSKKGQGGDTRASFTALFFGVLAATLLI